MIMQNCAPSTKHPLRIRTLGCGLIVLFLFVAGFAVAGTETQSDGKLPVPGQPLYEQALAFAKNRQWLEAKQTYRRLLQEFPAYPYMASVKVNLAHAAVRFIRSSVVAPPESILYSVEPGDSLDKIARRFRTTVSLLIESNSLADTRLRPGQTLRVWNSPFTIIVDKAKNILVLKTETEIIKTYPIATGAEGGTPAGEFTITSKMEHPTWFHKGEIIPPRDPRNALGTRWLGLDKPQYGIHGTIWPELIGQPVSHGCVRMLNADVEELYNLIPLGTKVIILD